MIHFMRQGEKLKPVYKSDIDKWNKLKENTIYCMRYKRDRNYKFHKLLFAVAQTVIDNLPEGHMYENKSAYNLIKAVEIATGYVDEIITMDGEIVMVPQSIDYESWDQEKIEEFYSKFLPYVSEHFGYNPEELEKNSMENL
jgi:hypothetical protein